VKGPLSATKPSTMNQLLETVQQRHADWVYLAIGPAHSADQQFPPFFRTLSGTKLCFLIDPRLEETPVCYTTPDPSATFVEIRDYFDYNEPTLHGLCAHAITTHTKLIVQAFTGEDIRYRYPLQLFGSRLLDHVLFDFTYSEGDCFVDFNKVQLLLKPDGTFQQPLYSPLATFKHHKAALLRELENRYNLIFHYVLNLYQVQMGRKEAREWYAPEAILPRLGPLCVAYNVPHTTATDHLLLLLTEVFADLSHAAGDAASLTDIISLIEAPGNAYIDALRLLRTILKEENSVPQ
jgi:hypothetical protein